MSANRQSLSTGVMLLFHVNICKQKQQACSQFTLTPSASAADSGAVSM